jgi:serine/threonine-protein kinase PknK
LQARQEWIVSGEDDTSWRCNHWVCDEEDSAIEPSGTGRPGIDIDIDGYRELTTIGTGASSVVYRAFDAKFDRWVAIKVLTADDPADPARKRFQREREITGRLGAHPFIVSVFDTGFTADGRPFIVMDLCEGGSLADRISQRGSLSVDDAIDIGIKMSDAVQAAHDLGVVHRDIKPQNILVSQYGPVLADFGIARAVVSIEHTQTLDHLTPMHAAPEALLDDAQTESTDVYSLGSTLFTLLAGRAPFAGPAGESPLRFQARVLRDPVPQIPRADLPPELMDILRRALAKSPTDRYSSARELGQALRGLQITRASGSPGHGQSEPAESINDLDPTVPSGLTDDAPTSYRPARIDPTPVADLRADALTTARARRSDARTNPDVAAPKSAAASKRPLLIGVAVVVILVAVGFLVLNQNADKTATTRVPKYAPITVPSAAPTDVTFLRDADNKGATVRWTSNSANAAGYLVFFQKPSQKQSSFKFVPAPADHLDIRGLDPGSDYCFRVTAQLDANKTAPSAAKCTNSPIDSTTTGASTDSPTPPSRP